MGVTGANAAAAPHQATNATDAIELGTGKLNTSKNFNLSPLWTTGSLYGYYDLMACCWHTAAH